MTSNSLVILYNGAYCIDKLVEYLLLLGANPDVQDNVS